MLISFNWLKDFVNIPKAITPQDLGLRLTMHTVEIDSVVRQADKFANVVVGKILGVKEHPNADRLRLVLVNTGKEKLEIVCGAPNIEVGQLVPVALAGAILPNGLEIKEAEVRGIKSNGMLCAEDELGLGNDHGGILILDKKAKIGLSAVASAKVGQNLSDYLNLKDIVFEVDNKSITNRPDLWGHYGLAREIAAFLGVKLKEYKFNKKLLEKSTGDIKLEAKVDDFSLCPRYMAVAMDGIKVGASPRWLEERLVAVGMRPINNIVDITNYVMLELGQPLHAFDASLVRNKDEYKILVRRAKNGETIETLDGEKRKLNNDTLVITDGAKPIAVAGVMGGANSEISSDSSAIIIESANFDFIATRTASSELGLRTESSMRFEKALDPNLAELALARTVELIKKLCPKARVVSNLVDEKKFELNQGPIELDLDWLGSRLGEKLERKKVVDILSGLGFVVEEAKTAPDSAEKLLVTIPTWRSTRDISIPEDLVEEVARIYGFNNLRPSMPKVEMQAPKISQERLLERKIKNILTGAPALTEVHNYSFVGEDQLKKLNIDYTNHIRLVNPIAEHQAMLRQSLAPNLINNIKTNQARVDAIAIFEIGSVYFPTAGELERGGKLGGQLPYQEKRIGIIFGAGSGDGVFDRAKGIVEHLTASLNLSVQFKRSEAAYNWADRQTCAMIEADGKTIGSVVKFDSRLREGLGLKKEAAVAEISFPELFSLVRERGEIEYQEPGKYPPAVRDLAFVIPAKILYNDIRDEILNFNPLIKKAELFDVYTGEKLGQNKKSLAFHITYQTDRTLTSEEVDELQKKLIKELEERFEAKIRDF